MKKRGRDQKRGRGKKREQEEAAEAKKEKKSSASESPPVKKKAPTAAHSAAGVLLSAPPAAELPKEVWFKFGETEESSVQIAGGSFGADLIEKIVNKLDFLKCQLSGPIVVSLPESLANDPNKLKSFCLEGSAEIDPRATLDTVFFRELGKQALVVTEISAAPAVAVKVRLDQTVTTIKGLRLGSSTVGDLKFQAVRVLSGPNERTADYSLFFDTTQPTIVWGSADSADWLEKLCEGIPAASADPAAPETMRKLKGDATLDQDFFRVVKGNVEITLRQTSFTAGKPLPNSQPPAPAAGLVTLSRFPLFDDSAAWTRFLRVFRESLPKKVVATGVAVPEMLLVGRETTFEHIFTSWAFRFKLRSVVSEQRFRNPHCATAGAPGTGKTRVLKELCKMCSGMEREAFDHFLAHAKRAERFPLKRNFFKVGEVELLPGDFDAMAAAFLDSIPLYVTYNNSTPFDFETSLKHFLGLRMLASYLGYDSSRSNWDNFRKWFKSLALWDDFDLSTAVRFILEDSGKKSIFLAVDEVLKTGKENAKQLAMLVGTLLDDSDRFAFSLISTLDSAVVHFSSSSRLIDWAPLPLLIGVAWKIFEMHPWFQKRVVKVCILDCGGHARTLECLQSALISQQIALSTQRPTHFYQTILNSFNELLPPSVSLSSFFQLIKAVLLADKLDRDTKIGEKSLHQHIINGNLDNPFLAEELVKVISQLSVFRILSWSKNVGIVEDYANADPVEVIVSILRHVLLTGDVFEEGSAVALGMFFEKFHCGWELIVATLRAGEVQSLHEHYRGAKVGQATSTDWLSTAKNQLSKEDTKRLEGANKAELEAVFQSGAACLNARFTHFRRGFQEYPADSCSQITKLTDELVGLALRNVIRPRAQNQPGFDRLFAVRTHEGSVVIVFLELKFSSFASSSPLSLTMAEAVKKYVACTKIAGGRPFVLVLISHRELDFGVKKLPPNVLVATDIKTLYGPTLGIRPMFFDKVWTDSAAPSVAPDSPQILNNQTLQPFAFQPHSPQKEFLSLQRKLFQEQPTTTTRLMVSSRPQSCVHKRHHDRHQWLQTPPLTSIVCPVTKGSCTRYSTACAMSAGATWRRSGIAWLHSGSAYPALTQLTRTSLPLPLPPDANSSAWWRVIASIAATLAAHTERRAPCCHRMALCAMLMTTPEQPLPPLPPPLRSNNSGKHSAVIFATETGSAAKSLTAPSQSNLAAASAALLLLPLSPPLCCCDEEEEKIGVSGRERPPSPTQQALTSTSMLLESRATAACTSRHPRSVEMSPTTTCASAPFAATRAAVASALARSASVFACTNTVPPAAANATATSAPVGPAACVTSAETALFAVVVSFVVVFWE